MPRGADGDAYVKILSEADGYTVALIRADTGYTTAPHEHAHAEFFLLPPRWSHPKRGADLTSGDAYAAAVGSGHTDLRSPGSIDVHLDLPALDRPRKTANVA